MISNILTNFFNCFTVPTLLLNYNFQTIFTHNHDSKIDISFYTSKAIEIVKNLNFISNTTSFNITNDISFSCISFNHYDNSKMYLLIGPYSTKELSNNNSEINILTEEWINNIIKLHTYIISNHIGKFNNLQNISPCVNHAIKYIEKNYSNEILIDDICAELNINKCYFCSVFKKETGCDIITYLSGLRIEHAKELLCTTQITIAEVAAFVGFNNQQTFMYAYNYATNTFDKLDTVMEIDGETMKLTGEVILKDHLLDQTIKIMVQNGEGYTPDQYREDFTGAMSNPADTPRENYDFTFAVESDTQYYNEDFDGNPDQDVDGNYQYQLDIHNWLLANRERMNIQYLFHDGDIIDDEDQVQEWINADNAYKMLDDARYIRVSREEEA